MRGLMPELTPELLVSAYARGIFPMGESATGAGLSWYEPQRRGVLPLEGFHISRSLIRTRRRGDFRFSCDAAFRAVMDGCADRPETWINAPIRRVFEELHARGLAHSVEVWEGGRLAGGVYGLALGGAFMAESMFSARTDGSKLALAELVARLRVGGFSLLDTQYLTPHLASLGGVEVTRSAYRTRLAQALTLTADAARAFGPVSEPGAAGARWRL
jgi:leucyl/phenylalanyl-tRNA---protein transferase